MMQQKVKELQSLATQFRSETSEPKERAKLREILNSLDTLEEQASELAALEQRRLHHAKRNHSRDPRYK